MNSGSNSLSAESSPTSPTPGRERRRWRIPMAGCRDSVAAKGGLPAHPVPKRDDWRTPDPHLELHRHRRPRHRSLLADRDSGLQARGALPEPLARDGPPGTGCAEPPVLGYPGHPLPGADIRSAGHTDRRPSGTDFRLRGRTARRDYHARRRHSPVVPDTADLHPDHHQHRFLGDHRRHRNRAGVRSPDHAHRAQPHPGRTHQGLCERCPAARLPGCAGSGGATSCCGKSCPT